MPKARKDNKCKGCGRIFKHGLWNHEPPCVERQKAARIRRQHRRNGARRAPDHRRVRESSPASRIPSPLPMDLDGDRNSNTPSPSRSRSLSPGANMRGRLHIEIEYHPHSGLDNAIILLDATPGSLAPIRPTRSTVSQARRPWAPFPTRPDFEWSETMYLQSRDQIQAQLKGIHGSWNPHGTAITIKTYAELQGLLEKSRKYVVEFESEDFTEEIDGEQRTFTAYFRDPWKFILELVTDPSLASDIVWYPYRKYLVIDGARQRLRDEAYSADLWWDMQVCLHCSPPHSLIWSRISSPHIPGMHHCIAPLMLWLDEGRVTSHTNMYPMLLRALALPSAIRNGSGNGGSWLAGFMVQIRDHRDPKTRTTLEKIDFAFRKRNLYHRVLRRVFNGESVTCGDATPRVLFPAIPIASLDGKEADMYTNTRAALAHFPCARCLVRADQLCQISGHIFEPRTTASMKKIYQDAQNMRYKKDAEELLQGYGLHAVANAFWEIENSSPYEAASYDNLHSDDHGKFGKRIWIRVREVLDGLGTTGLLTKNMANVPRWPGLKHFENVTTKQMNDGQQYLDIEKCILPCIVQLLPNNSPWIHVIRAHIRYRMILGLHCITDEQIARKEKYTAEYEKWCKASCFSFSFTFYHWNFPKQHDIYHSSDDIRLKGAPTLYCTRVNEGSHQENRDSAQHVNHRNNDQQVSTIDATKEAMARIRMTINAYDNEQEEEVNEIAEHVGVPAESVRATVGDLAASDEHWRVGAPGKLEDSRFALRNASWLDDDTRRDFDKKLRAFLRDTFPDEAFRADGEQPIDIRRCSCIYVHYTSAEDYTDKFDLLRCNPNFQTHNEKRFDCVNVNLTPDALDFARILGLFRCRLPSKREVDVALVRLFKAARWKPKTVWENCRVLEDGRTTFILPEYFIRGAHLINAFGSKKEDTIFYLNDVVDSDWFLRAGN
ncbi:hypothetical protein C8F01DRAFT_1065057 [Mycena amicta]|nr:hypothetical protein C8F01DRAFT_1065057 [Mycena amicta]